MKLIFRLQILAAFSVLIVHISCSEQQKITRSRTATNNINSTDNSSNAESEAQARNTAENDNANDNKAAAVVTDISEIILAGNKSIHIYADSCAELSVSFENKDGIPASLATDVVLKIESNDTSETFTFFSDGSCSDPITQQLVAKNASLIKLFVKGKKLGESNVKLVLATNKEFALSLRTLQPGLPSENFGRSGFVTEPSAFHTAGKDIVLQSDGRAIVVGEKFGKQISDYEMVLYRYMANGDRDETFGQGGSVNGIPEASITRAVAAALTDDGKILVLGDKLNSNLLSVVRLLKDGRVDTSFGTNGIASSSFGDPVRSILYAQSLVMLKDGSILASFATPAFAGIAKFSKDGVLSTSFGNQGFIQSDFTNPNDNKSVLAVTREGGLIWATMPSFGEQRNKIIIQRYTSEGQLDRTFGIDGVASMPSIDGVFSSLFTMALSIDGKIMIGGDSEDHSKYQIARLTARGQLDSNFGRLGLISGEWDSTCTYSRVHDFAFQSDGKFIVGGYGYCSGGNGLIVARFLNNGTLDPAFGELGVTSTIGENSLPKGTFFSVALNEAGQLYATGVGVKSDTPEKRYEFITAKYGVAGRITE